MCFLKSHRRRLGLSPVLYVALLRLQLSFPQFLPQALLGCHVLHPGRSAPQAGAVYWVSPDTSVDVRLRCFVEPRM